MTPSKIAVVEKQNPHLRINCFGYEDEEVFPLYVSERLDAEAINLLYFVVGDKKHYCLIRDFSRLMSHATDHNGATHYCYFCLHRFSRRDLLDDHLPYCGVHAPQRIKMPQGEDIVMKFNQQKYEQRVPYMIYADFETLVEKLDTTDTTTMKTAVHKPCGYAYVVIGPDGKPYKPPVVHRSDGDVVEHFLTNVIALKEELTPKLTHIAPMKITASDERIIRNATHCGLCKKVLGADRVRDHDHLTGKFRQVLHNKCNLAFRLRKILPIAFHNLKNFDGHLLMQGLGKYKDHDIHVIPNTPEKYISFSIVKKMEKSPVTLQFIDSLAFLNASLQKLVDNLESDQFSILKSCFTSPNVDLLLRKGIYPYEYMDSPQKFNDVSLPPIEAFFSTLTNTGITAEEYDHAQSVWRAFGIHTMGEYHDLYVKTDVLLLADVFENFRQLTMTNYGLDAAHMMTAPGLAFQAALKMSGVELELFSDINMHLFIERGIRGGVSMISHRYSKANIPGRTGYDATEPNRHILYLDANNLYGMYYFLRGFFKCILFEQCHMILFFLQVGPCHSLCL